MTTVDQQIESAASAISSNIAALSHNRPLLAQNILSQLRNLVEGIAVRLHAGRGDVEFQYSAVDAAISHVGSKGQLNFVARFHKLLQISASHYTMGGDPSERLMLKYYDYLSRLRDLASAQLGLSILGNLEGFPVDLDPSLREYHQKIAERIVAARSLPSSQGKKARYYIHAVRPFYAEGHIYYEVTFYNAVNNVSKFDRIIGFTDIDINNNYAAYLVLESDAIQVLGQTMLALTINTGLRVSELINLTTTSIHVSASPYVECEGKGRKHRATPLNLTTRDQLQAYLFERRTRPGTALFPGPHGTPLSRDAVEHRLAVHVRTAAESCPPLKGKHVTMHALRHTTAMNLRHAGVDITVIALWLGHEQTTTTDRYLHADTEIKKEALNKTRPADVTPGTYTPLADILTWLENL